MKDKHGHDNVETTEMSKRESNELYYKDNNTTNTDSKLEHVKVEKIQHEDSKNPEENFNEIVIRKA